MRTSISVPDELKARMDKHGQGVNWSSVACRAFERELADIITKKGAKDVNDVISRLRATKAKAEDIEFKRGFRFGQDWAKNQASADQLVRLEEHRNSLGSDWECWFTTDGTSYLGSADWLFSLFFPERENDRDQSRDFWQCDQDNGPLTPDYLRGFSEGALDVWHSVKDQL